MESPSDEDVNNVLNRCSECEDEGTSQFNGMSYEQGVAAAIRWMLGETKDNPLAG